MLMVSLISLMLSTMATFAATTEVPPFAPAGARVVTEGDRTWLYDPDLPGEGRTPIEFAADIRNFQAIDARKPTRPGCIVFAGSSTFTNWQDVPQHFKPLPVLNRAYGGSVCWEQWYYADRTIIPHRPRLVVVYIGDNDIARLMSQPSPDAPWDKSPADVAFYIKYVDAFVQRIRAELPRCRFIFCSTKPSRSRWLGWETCYVPANEALEKYCESQRNIKYVDTASAMFGPDGLPDENLYLDDALHINSAAYDIWTEILKPVVRSMW